ncbi:F-box domain-containing protein [Mycena sanguinolenta]|uniref:F-box domain-containing protein n=1 Tax=Mycena sanguinolenta TaxID=230812 RepID=A0A8H6YH87_9AGAR|nr:F-box domain-containing protein [Mycena sanguinolenta]
MLFDSVRQTLAETEASMDEYHGNDQPVPDELVRRWEALTFELDNVIYPVLTLPLEITLEIFMHFISFLGIEGNPMLLLQICRTWREIALATPLLWSALNLTWVVDDPRDRIPLEVDDGFIQQWLERAAAVPLSLGFFGHMAEKWSAQVEALVARHAPRIDTLHLDFFAEGGFEWLAEPRQFPELRKLTLACHIGHQSGMPTFAVAPRLRDVTLRSGVGLRYFVLPWGNLTSVAADCVTTTECLRVLTDAPRLTRGSFLVTAPPEPHNSPVTHAALRELDLRGCSLLELLTLPNLRVLTLAVDAASDEVGKFLKRSAKSLREFSFTLSSRSLDEASIDWFWTARGLTTLSLLDIPDRLSSEFFAALREGVDAHGVRFLPQLRRLEIQQVGLKVDAFAVGALRSRWVNRLPNTVQLLSVRLVDSKEFQSLYGFYTENATHWNQLDATIDWDGLYDLARDGMELHVGTPETNFVWEC